MKTITYAESQKFAKRCIDLQNDLMTAGLFETYHQMHKVTQKIGWELSKIMEGKHPTKLTCPHGFVNFDDCADCCH